MKKRAPDNDHFDQSNFNWFVQQVKQMKSNLAHCWNSLQLGQLNRQQQQQKAHNFHWHVN